MINLRSTIICAEPAEISVISAGLIMMKKSPDLLHKRLNAKEEQDEQKTVLALLAL